MGKDLRPAQDFHGLVVRDGGLGQRCPCHLCEVTCPSSVKHLTLESHADHVATSEKL